MTQVEQQVAVCEPGALYASAAALLMREFRDRGRGGAKSVVRKRARATTDARIA
jgi:hypothetical protein